LGPRCDDLCLATGRPDDAAGILRTYASYVADGLLPNDFRDQEGIPPDYNTADAALWYILAVRAHHEATRNTLLLDDLLPVIRGIVDRYVAGTQHGIGMDRADALMRAGQPQVPVTWMDAKVDDRPITPRTGKPVEVNALWYNALRALTGFLAQRGDTAARQYDGLADRVRASFRARFIREDLPHLADVVDGPDGDDWTLRPNQILAVSLPAPLLEAAEAAPVVDAVRRELMTTYGLRTLNRGAPAYHGRYEGDQPHRDAAYHQGTVWAWLMGAFAEASHRVNGDAAAARRLLEIFELHLSDAGLGTISEIFDGDAPHEPRGCIAQAWSVAEVLRVWRRLATR
jgi:predicted glycogen debranching enzyme